jgi:hypothetical protein
MVQRCKAEHDKDDNNGNGRNRAIARPGGAQAIGQGARPPPAIVRRGRRGLGAGIHDTLLKLVLFCVCAAAAIACLMAA